MREVGDHVQLEAKKNACETHTDTCFYDWSKQLTHISINSSPIYNLGAMQ